jgi:hypothetical protein
MRFSLILTAAETNNKITNRQATRLAGFSSHKERSYPQVPSLFYSVSAARAWTPAKIQIGTCRKQTISIICFLFPRVLPNFFQEHGYMLCAVPCHRMADDGTIVMISKTTFFLGTAGFFVAVEIPAPQALQAKFFKGIALQFPHSLRYQTLPPKRHTDPIANLALCLILTQGLSSPTYRPRLPMARSSSRRQIAQVRS